MKKYRPYIFGGIIIIFIMLLMAKIIFGRNRGVFNDLSYYNNMSHNEEDYPIIKDINELEEETREKCQEFLSLCQQEGLPVIIIETYRTQERQDFLYAQGRANDNNIVTWTRSSYHTRRKAFDIAKNEKGNEFGDDEFFKRCAEIGESVGLEAGYFWTDYQDKGHFQN
ncbi:M15 family metallopeptidase [Miniphocaeibacter halophilus]|uniref:M15 family metallopeptidase n=1 Tax=Miniphocaeibacter halophilus TaxID=2931922 RepID=A0AC61MS86_9FIRM|nr:M15 family metallopeptidase [Miniphocaeibacter halophilus]QQK08470.1 M15 family metallopeptidase [Miniphocaeibacter halophilus]